MNRFITALSLAAIVLIGIAATTKNAPKEEGIKFNESPWGKIMAQAKKEKKLVFFDAYASWCGPCKKLQREVFTRPEVAAYFNANFINTKKDMEIGEGPTLAAMYPIEGYPTLFFLDHNGKIVTQQIGYIPAEQLLKIAKSVAKK
ncbi:MAG: thioredoxin family protein [Spirosomaceae bacterium]|jgi:thioredoxin 1|nr:thioredoxin family protein [Spirosomataceae bacterium]